MAHHDLGTDLLFGLHSFSSFSCTAVAGQSGLLADVFLCSPSPAFLECVLQNIYSSFGRKADGQRVLHLPYQFVTERYLTEKHRQSPFVRQASPFQDIVIRCVRYAFAKIPARIGRVFFSKGVALPFFRFRMLRHGYRRSPISWREISVVSQPTVTPFMACH